MIKNINNSMCTGLVDWWDIGLEATNSLREQAKYCYSFLLG